MHLEAPELKGYGNIPSFSVIFWKEKVEKYFLGVISFGRVMVPKISYRFSGLRDPWVYTDIDHFSL